MIPKKIHYCWFGGNPKSKVVKKCINSWKKICSGYEIIEWNESNFNISTAPLYVRQAYKAKKWAYVTDYVRLYVVHEYGGIYLDTDVQVIKCFDGFLHYNAFFGFENTTNISTGLGFGAVKGLNILCEIMNQYSKIPFALKNGYVDMTPCPQRNTDVFLNYGLKQNGETQLLDDNIIVLATEYLCPIDYETLQLNKTKNTISIHWFNASWMSSDGKKHHIKQARHRRRVNNKHIFIHFPNKILKKIVGNDKYNALKQILKK